MVNDAASIILFQAVQKVFVIKDELVVGYSAPFEWYQSFTLFGDFILVSVYSIGIGLSFGLVCTLIMKYARYK